jgi:hypothetical protein
VLLLQSPHSRLLEEDALEGAKVLDALDLGVVGAVLRLLNLHRCERRQAGIYILGVVCGSACSVLLVSGRRHCSNYI